MEYLKYLHKHGVKNFEKQESVMVLDLAELVIQSM